MDQVYVIMLMKDFFKTFAQLVILWKYYITSYLF
jgi:hypothetical protein